MPMCCYQCCVHLFVIIITCVLSAIQYCIAQKLNGKNHSQKFNKGKVDELIVGFKGEALREESWLVQ